MVTFFNPLFPGHFLFGRSIAMIGTVEIDVK